MAGFKEGDVVSVAGASLAAKVDPARLIDLAGDNYKTSTLIGKVVGFGRGKAPRVKFGPGVTVDLAAKMLTLVGPQANPHPQNLAEAVELPSEDDDWEQPAEGGEGTEDLWKEGPVVTCQRMAAGHGEPRLGRMRATELRAMDPDHASVAFFMEFMPMDALKEVLELTTATGKEKYGATWSVDMKTFQRFIGIWMLMTRCQLPNRERYWKQPSPEEDICFNFSQYMSFKYFNQLLHVLTLPRSDADAADKFSEDSAQWLLQGGDEESSQEPW